MMPADPRQGTTTGSIMLASLVGTAIEFYDFYIYGTAAALVLGRLFFPATDAGAQSLAAFATFGIAFVARPVGSFLFGHFGDRRGRKSTLVWSLVVMGLSTTLIGVLPSYAQAGALAPALLCLLRLGQGIGLGGEWGGAALLATENAPKGRQALFGMFPQLGPPLGFLLSNGLFLLLFTVPTDAQFAAWGWRIPFLASALLVAVYISTVFALDYGTRIGHIPRGVFLEVLCAGIVVMGIVTPVSALLSDRFGFRPVLLAGSALAGASGFAMAPLLGQGTVGGALVFVCLELALMGLVFAPMGALLPSLFPPEVRYTGASATYNIGGVLGASLAPYAAQILLIRGGLPAVGLYITIAAAVSFLALVLLRPFSPGGVGQQTFGGRASVGK